MPLKIGPLSPDPAVAKDFAAARNLLPVASPWKLNYALKKTLDIYVAAPALAAAHPAEASFFPDKPGIVKGSAPQTMGFSKDGLVLRLQPGDKAAANGPLTGVLVLKSSDGSIQALDVSAPVGPVPQVFGGGETGAAEAGIGVAAGDGLRLYRRIDPECDALRAADPGDEGAGAGGPGRRRP